MTRRNNRFGKKAASALSDGIKKESKKALRQGKRQKAAVLTAVGIALALLSGRSLSPYFSNLSELVSESGYGAEINSAEVNGAGEYGTEINGAEINGADGERAIEQIAVEEAELVKVVDGDTIRVRIQGEEQKVRLLEIDAPESVHSDKSRNTVFGKRASEHLSAFLSDTDTVYLTRDTSDTDRYGRLLRLVWLKEPEDPTDSAALRENCINARMLLDGYAETAIYDDAAYEDIFRAFEEEARASARGLWADEEWLAYLKE